MNGIVTRTKASCIILGILLTILGLTFFVFPFQSTIVFAMILGWLFIVGGIATIISYATNQAGGTRSGADLAVGIIETILGILVVVFPGAFAAYFFVLLGCIILVTGIFDIVEAISMHDIEGSRWGVWLFLGILTVVLGILTFAAPLAWAEVVMILVGCSLVYDGITEIVVGIRL